MALLEVTTFQVAGDEDAFLAADVEAQTTFFYAQPGFVRRTTARAGDGEWLVVVVWGSAADADAAASAAKADPAATAWDAVVDTASLRTARYETLD